MRIMLTVCSVINMGPLSAAVMAGCLHLNWPPWVACCLLLHVTALYVLMVIHGPPGSSLVPPAVAKGSAARSGGNRRAPEGSREQS